MRQIKATILRPKLGKNNNIRHVLTTYQIASSIEFTDDNIIVAGQLESSNLPLDAQSETMLLTLEDVDENTNLYLRCKHHFKRNGSDEILDGEWSRILSVAPINANFSISNQIVSTPKVTIKEEEDRLVISTSDFNMYSGVGKHMATTYDIVDTNNIKVTDRNMEDTLLTNIEFRNNTKIGHMYIARAKHINNFNSNSLYGKDLYIKFIPNIDLFEFVANSELIINRKFYYKIKIFTTNFSKYDLYIKDLKDNNVYELTDLTNTVGSVLLDKLIIGTVYNIFIKIKFSTGEEMELQKVYTGVCIGNKHYPSKVGIEYIEKYTAEQDVMLNGINCTTLRQLFTGEIIGPSYTGNELYIYNTNLTKVKTIYRFEENLGLDYFNMVQLPTGDILVDILTYNSNKQLVPTFIKFEWNNIRQELKEISRLERPDEMYNTAMSCSMVCTGSLILVYIPAYATDGITTKRQRLSIKTIDIEKMEFINTLLLPDPVIANATLVYDHMDKIYVFGGSFNNKYDEDISKAEYFERDTNKVYEYYASNNTVKEVATIPKEWPIDVWCMQPFLRLDNKVVLFNATPTGPGVSNQDVLIFNTVNKEFTIEKIDHRWNIPFRNNVVLLNGNIRRISSRAIDPQKSITYVSNTIHRDNVISIDGGIADSTTLVVEDGKVVSIEDIYKYRTITIRGSGILLWYRPQGITEITAEDLIINRVRTVSYTALKSNKYRNLIVLDGTDFHIQ